MILYKVMNDERKNQAHQNDEERKGGDVVRKVHIVIVVKDDAEDRTLIAQLEHQAKKDNEVYDGVNVIELLVDYLVNLMKDEVKYKVYHSIDK